MPQKYTEEDLIPLPESSDSESDISDNEQSDVSIGDSDQDFVTGSGSDSEPECYSFSATQESRRQAQKLASKAIKFQSDELKRKRKEINLQNLKQREEKRRKITSKRLPDEVLENLDDELDVRERIPEEKIEEPSEETEENEVETEIVTTSGNITFKCKVLPAEPQKERYIPKKVAHFKEEMLYGNRIKREKTNRHAVLKREKQSLKR